MATILCVDDEPAVGVVLDHALKKMGHRPLIAHSVADAVDVVGREAVDLVIADYRMPDATGLDLIARLQADGTTLPVIVMTAYSSIEHAVTSIKQGAIDYLTKPIRAETLGIAVEQALEVVKLRRENQAFRQEIESFRSTREIVGDSPVIRAILRTVATVAPTRATVLIMGESGTGKELLARAIHGQSPRHDQPFVSLNCAALPEGLVESALFGHEKGAFTGATARTPGAFERAHRGTLLLDEISEMRLDLQAKLLRVVQEQEFERVGGNQPINVDVRLIATTNRNLKDEVQAGRFREDLFYRLNVVPILSPPLRERISDVPLLVRHFINRAVREHGTEVTGVTPETIDVIRGYDWPGNVRELGNAIERAVILSAGSTLGPEMIRTYIDEQAHTPSPAPDADDDGNDRDIPLNLRALERQAIDRALVATEGNRTQAARLLGISERTLRNKLNTPTPTA